MTQSPPSNGQSQTPVELLAYRVEQVERQLRSLTNAIEVVRIKVEDIHTEMEVSKADPKPGSAPACVEHLAEVKRMDERLKRMEEDVKSKIDYQSKVLDTIQRRVWIGMGIIIGANAALALVIGFLVK